MSEAWIQARQATDEPVVVAALYHFADWPEFAEHKAGLSEFCVAQGVRGTLLLAPEGINGTVSGTRSAIDALLARLHSDSRFAKLEHKESFAERHPFLRLKIKLKREIVTLGKPVDPTALVGTYVKPAEWNALISDPAVLVIDTRNDYEVAIGSFAGAVDPKTTNFSDFPAYVSSQLDPKKHTRVAMFCTGGIRCEKASSYMRQQGFNEVYHLQGGILKYLEEVPVEDSLWQGECFVFDERVAVKHGLEQGEATLCYGCRRALIPTDLDSSLYEYGISCAYCYQSLSANQRKRFAERRLQLALAAKRLGKA